MAIQLVSPSDSAGAAGPVQKRQRSVQAAPQAGSEAVSNPSSEQIQQAVQDIQRAVEPVANNLNFSIDQESGKTVIRVVDSATQELIRQIPSEEVMSISHAINRLAGLLVQEKA
jgi:flagellar protein FlaG